MLCASLLLANTNSECTANAAVSMASGHGGRHGEREGMGGRGGIIRLEGEDRLMVRGKKGSSSTVGTGSGSRGGTSVKRRKRRGGSVGVVVPTLERDRGGGVKGSEMEMDVEEERIDYVSVDEVEVDGEGEDGDDDNDNDENGGRGGEAKSRRRNRERIENAQTTLAILNALHLHASLLLSRIDALLPPSPRSSSSPHTFSGTAVAEPIILTPRDLLALDLGPFSALDARLVEWLAEVYQCAPGRRVSVRRGWRDYVSLVMGCG